MKNFLVYLIRKFLYSFLILFGVIVVAFFLFQVLPGDPARFLTGQRADAETIRIIRKELGLDLPPYLQFLSFVNNLSPISLHNKKNHESSFFLKSDYKYLKIMDIGDEYILILKIPYLGRSFVTRRPVTDIFAELIPTTLILAFAAMIITTIGGILLGILAFLVRGTFLDNLIIFLATLGISGPSFFMGLLFYILGVYLESTLKLKLLGPFFVIDDFGNEHFEIRHVFLPAITLGIRPLSLILQLMRSSMIEVFTEDYIRTAYAKGLPKFIVIFKHAFPNAINPIITTLSIYFAGFMAGAIFIEYVFNLRGLGWESVEALNAYDLPVIMAFIIFSSAVFILTALLIDIIYAIIDPRVRLK